MPSYLFHSHWQLHASDWLAPLAFFAEFVKLISDEQDWRKVGRANASHSNVDVSHKDGGPSLCGALISCNDSVLVGGNNMF